MKVSSNTGIQNFQHAEPHCSHLSTESTATDYRKSFLKALILCSYSSLNAKVGQSKNCPFGINTTIRKGEGHPRTGHKGQEGE
jgi:hypothetical protein